MSKSFAKLIRAGLHKAGLFIKKEAPTILIFTGIAGLGTTAVTACVQTTKIKPVLEQASEDISAIKKAQEAAKDGYIEYDNKEVIKDKAVAYGKAALGFAKVYAVPWLLFLGSSASILFGCGIFKKRHAALTAAYVAVDTSFKKYRERVAEKYGPEVEKQIRYNLTEKEISNENKEVLMVKADESFNGVEEGAYTRVFDSSCYKRLFGNEYTYDKSFINIIFATLNNNFCSKGDLFLNTALSAFGFDKIKEGQYLGWHKNMNDPDSPSYINVQVHEVLRPINGDEANGYETVFIIDFIPDGNILDLAFKK